MKKHLKEITKKCKCGVEIKIVRSCGKYIALETRPEVVHVEQYGAGRGTYKPVAGLLDHKFQCPIKKKDGGSGA